MDLVGEDEMKDRAGRNQPRERSRSMRNRKKGQRAKCGSAGGQERKRDREKEGGRGFRRARTNRREETTREGECAGSRYRINETPLMGRGLDPRLITSRAERGKLVSRVLKRFESKLWICGTPRAGLTDA